MRKTIIILSVCTAVLLAGYAGYRGYKVWKQAHMMSLARAFLAKPDPRNAVLCLQQVLAANPRNLEAVRLMGQLTDAAHSPSALVWRTRAVELAPQSLGDRLALAQTALSIGNSSVAASTLEGVDDAGKKTAPYHNLAGAVAIANKQLAEAEMHFLEASRLEPTNPAPQLNLAVVRLHGTNQLDIAEARISLQRIIASSANSSLRCLALRELIADAMNTRQSDPALTLSKQLLQETNSAFGDRVLRLEVLRLYQNSALKPSLQEARNEASTNVAKVFALAVWEMKRSSPSDTLSWLRQLPGEVRTNQQVLLLAAQCQVQMQDWTSLRTSLTNQNWGDSEMLRHAFCMRALRGQDLSAAAKGEWEQALTATRGDKGNLTLLLQAVKDWQWRPEAKEILWTLVDHFPSEKWAFNELGQYLQADGQTRPLMALFVQQMRNAPNDLDVKNNLAVVALLLDAQELKPYDLAHEVYQKAPTNASYASTYAFSLYCQKKYPDALKVMQQLNPRQLETPSISGYYGVILKANGDTAKAKSYLTWANRARLLPEEKKLFDQAQSGT